MATAPPECRSFDSRRPGQRRFQLHAHLDARNLEGPFGSSPSAVPAARPQMAAEYHGAQDSSRRPGSDGLESGRVVGGQPLLAAPAIGRGHDGRNIVRGVVALGSVGPPSHLAGQCQYGTVAGSATGLGETGTFLFVLSC